MTKKVLFTIGSRANYGRLCSLISKFQSSSYFDVEIAVHSSAIVDKYGDISETLESHGHSPSWIVHTLLHSDGSEGITKTLALGISEFGSILRQTQPDFVVVGGDRYEILAPSIATMFHSAQLIHLQGGEVSGNVDEKVRNSVTKMSDIHFPATELAFSRLIAQGTPPEKTFNCGCPGMDVVINSKYPPVDFGELNAHGFGRELDEGSEFCLLIVHPESFDEAFNLHAMDLILSALEKLDVVKNVIALWPNADLDNGAMARALRVILDHQKYSGINIKVFKGFSPEKFVGILANSKFCIGNSSSFVREGAVLGKPVVIVGDRQNNRDITGNVRLADITEMESVSQAILWANNIQSIKPDYAYGRGTSSEHIYDSLLSLC